MSVPSTSFLKGLTAIRIRLVVPVIVLSTALLSGCAAGGDPEESPALESTSASNEAASPPETAAPEPTEAAKTGATLADTATKLNCTDYALAATVAPGAAEYGTCQLDGVRVQLYRFANLDDKQIFLDQVKAYGVVESQLAVTDDGSIAAAPADQRLLVQLQDALRE
ncbi:hypothetical protein GRS96_01175 [Rathayibacter sp. VKM Ac-2803]|uniref:hypothetical protein n=1 Tax=Rathayibacter sp. VKM Ac-2803 TaxID=2609256 RepID=UPI001359DA52|nr:hypothetical protein [Rathayibacter sp. VKM Ac-2803]MWV47883.1 hypothetical protein [Rathayibacter sp. VKM Ac-2803]